MTRLTDLNPRWIDSEERHGLGICFDCPGPCCEGAPSLFDWEPGMRPYKARAGLIFSNPVDGGAPLEGQGCGWERSGDKFETLTLSPSVFISPPDHWHGFITNGQVT